MDAIVLAGGSGRRMGGVDKPSLLVGGRTLLDRVIAACAGAANVVVVGTQRETQRPVRFTRETPPGGGPVAAIAAGLPLVGDGLVAVLAADLPFLTEGTLRLLAANVTPACDGSLLVDDTGRDQLLAGVWWSASLRRVIAAAGPPEGLALGRVLSGLSVVRVPPRELVDPSGPQPWRDCDTPEDLQRAEELA